MGHDFPKEVVDLNWIKNYKDSLWIHCKNLEALNFFIKFKEDLIFFWHEDDRYTLTSNNFIWTYPGEKTSQCSILVNLDYEKFEFKDMYGVCSDYISNIKKDFESNIEN